MAKGFTERERELIRKKLISACKECWDRYGYHKTGIRELTGLAGISPAAFYQFHASKELLFVETAHDYEKESVRLFTEYMDKQPDKRGVAASVNAVVRYIGDSPWVKHMHEDWETIARKLPEGYLEDDFRNDTTRIESLAAAYGLKMTRPPEFVTAVIDMIFISVTNNRFLPDDGGAAAEFIVESVIDKLFE